MPNLNEYSDSKRLAIFRMLTAACGHLYSKNQLQQDKFVEAAKVFADLAKNDPLFLANYAAWAAKQDSKDQKVLTVFFNALSDADGSPFFKGAEACKPNLRQVSHALLQNLDVPLALRVAELAQVRFGVPNLLNEARHFPTALKTALRKYVLYREANQQAIAGIRNKGLKGKFSDLYRAAGVSPSDYVVGMLKWNQKDGRRWKDFQQDALPAFENLTSREIVDALAKHKLSPLVAVSVIPREKITSAVAAALLGNCTGNQAIALYNWFASNGFLDVKAIAALFKDKAATATTAVDRIDTLTRNASAEDKETMSEIRSERRKAQAATSDLGLIFMMIDCSGSMEAAIEFARNSAGIFAECVSNPEKNFGWGVFNMTGRVLPTPRRFRREDFHAALYGQLASGGTDCYALYERAREFGSDIDVYLTDEAHHCAPMETRIAAFHRTHPDAKKPRACIVVKFRTTDRGDGGRNDHVETGYTQNGIPVAVMTPESLKESALVAQAVQAAIKGETAIIDEIMDTPLPALPRWWAQVGKAVKHEPAARTV